MKEIFFVWVAVLIQSHAATPEQVQSIQRSWQPACAEHGGELLLMGAPRIWNGKEAFVIEGQCQRGKESDAVPARQNA